MEEATATAVEVVNQADCYFYYYSSCNKGKSCPYRHEPSALRNETMCVYWLKGSCNKPNCFYRHMEINKPRDKIPCYFEKQPGGCKKLHCPFFHNNVMDQPREEDVAKKNDIILPVKDSEAEYQTPESESKKIQASICAQLRLQRQIFENDDTSDIPSPPLVLRQPIIVPLYDGESDSESLYCPSPQKSNKNGRSTFDAETDWELERLREIQVEEGNILGYSFETEDNITNNRQTIISSSSSESYEEREEYFTEEEIIEEEILEDVKDAVHRRLQQPLQRTLNNSANISIDATSNLSPKFNLTSADQKVMAKRKVLSASGYERVAMDSKVSHSIEDEETKAADMLIPRRSEDNRNNDNRIVKKSFSVKDRLGVHRNLETVSEKTIDKSVKSRLGLAGKELIKISVTSPNKKVDCANDLEIDLHEAKVFTKASPLRGQTGASMHDGRLSIRKVEEKRVIKDSKVDINCRRLGVTDSKLNLNSSRINIIESNSGITRPASKLGTSISDSKLIKPSRLAVQNSEVHTTRNKLGSKISQTNKSIEETRAKPRLSLKERNASGEIPSSANLIIKSLADIRAERGISPPRSTKGDRGLIYNASRLRRPIQSASSIDLSLSALIGERTGRLDEERTIDDVGVIKIKTLAEIKAEKERVHHIPSNKAETCSISPNNFGTSSNKRKLNPIEQSNGVNTLTKVRKIETTSINFEVGSRKLDIKKTPPKLTSQANHVNKDKCTITIKPNCPNSNYISNSSSLRLQDHRKISLDKQNTGIESSKKITLITMDLPTPSRLGSNEIISSNTGTGNSKPFMKINYTNNCIKEIQKHLSSSCNNNLRKLSNTSHLDSFIDEDELLGDELHDSYGDEDDEFNEEELLS